MEADQQLGWLARRAQLLSEHVMKESVSSLCRDLTVNLPCGAELVQDTEQHHVSSGPTSSYLDEDEISTPVDAEESFDREALPAYGDEIPHLEEAVVFHGKVFNRPDDQAVAILRMVEDLNYNPNLQVYYVNGTACFDPGFENLPSYLGVGLVWYPQGQQERPFKAELWRGQQYPIEWRQDQREDRVGLKGIEFALRYAMQARLRDLSSHVTRGRARVIIFTDCEVEQLRAIERARSTKLEELEESDRTIHGIHKLAKWLYGYATELEIHSLPSMSGMGMTRARYQAVSAARTTREIAAEVYGQKLPSKGAQFVAGNERPRIVQTAP